MPKMTKMDLLTKLSELVEGYETQNPKSPRVVGMEIVLNGNVFLWNGETFEKHQRAAYYKRLGRR